MVILDGISEKLHFPILFVIKKSAILSLILGTCAVAYH